MAEHKVMPKLEKEDPEGVFWVESRLGTWAVMRAGSYEGLPADTEGLNPTVVTWDDVPFD